MARKTDGRVAGGNPSLPPFVPITLDRPRRLLFDFNALIALGDEIKENMLAPGAWDRALGVVRDSEDARKVVSVNTTPRNLRALLWAALLADDPEVTLQQAGAMLHPGNIGRVVEALNRAQRVQADDEIESLGDDIRPTEAELAKAVAQ